MLFILFFALFLFCLGIVFVYFHASNSNTNDNNNTITDLEIGQNGRFGNQCFQIACVLGLSEKYKKKPKLNWPMGNMLFGGFDDVLPKKCVSIQETNSFGFDDFLPTTSKPLAICGYRQHINYFKNIDIKKYFTFKQECIDNIVNTLPIINKPCIGLHVRRGDYLKIDMYNVCNLNYYIQAIHGIYDKYGTNIPIIVMTDDKKWCMENLPFTFIMSPFEKDYEDFICLYLCKYKILSNSTFSWWAAYLSESTDVVVPYPWLKQTKESIQFNNEWENLYCTNWHKIACY